MDLPQPPPDQELKNIIDKLAQFVARNGPEFEQMIKTKQKDNPKFSFLFGGDFFNYYSFKVTTEQAIIKHRQQQQPSQPPQINPNAPQTYPPPMASYPNPAQYSQFQSYPPHHQPQQQNPLVHHQNPHSLMQQPPNSHQSQPPPPSPAQQQPPPPPQHQQPPPPPHLQGVIPPGHQPQNQPPNSGPPPQHLPPPMSFQPNNQPPPNFQSSQNFMQPITSSSGGFNQHQPGGHAPTKFKTNDQNSGFNANPYQEGYTSASSENPVFTGDTRPPGTGNNNDTPISTNMSNLTVSTSDSVENVKNALQNIAQQQQVLHEQIKQSEHNLSAQHQVLQQQRETQMQEGLYVARGEVLRAKAQELGLDPNEIAGLLTAIRETCTKDSISAGKLWIFTNATDHAKNTWISNCLNYHATSHAAPFTHKLHIIYLMNDVLHSCQRKGSLQLKEELQRALVPMFCHASSVATEDKRPKLDKLLSLWENKLDLGPEIICKLQNPIETWRQVEASFQDDFPQVTQTIGQHLDSTYEGYKQQHQAFVQHAASQIQQLETQKAQIESKNQQQPAPQQPPLPPAAGIEQLNVPPPNFNASAAPAGQSVPLFDFSKPPPGFSSGENDPEVNKENLVPTVPYFELPAGLMCPMVADHESKYRSIVPSKLRLPPPTPPTERLLQAVENFYQPPSHEHPRNSEGWEQLSLYDYYKKKSDAVAEHAADLESRGVAPTPSPTPVLIESMSDETKSGLSVPARRYRSVSPEKLVEPVQPNDSHLEPVAPASYTKSTPPLEDDSNSSSPPPSERGFRRSPRGRSPPSQRSRSRSNSPPTMSRGFQRSLSRSPSPVHSRPNFGNAMPTLPDSRFGPGNQDSRFGSVNPDSRFGLGNSDSRLGAGNKGHQMLKKMGWGGQGGLGRQEQGIADPIDAGEIRDDPQERFRGLGVPATKNDPFEAFRKNKGRAYIGRMKARAGENN